MLSLRLWIVAFVLLVIGGGSGFERFQIGLPPEPLEPISMNNWLRVRQVAVPGEVDGRVAWWSGDGQTVFRKSVFGDFVYNVNNPADFVLLEEGSLSRPPFPLVDIREVSYEQSFAYSVDRTMSLQVRALPSDERLAYLVVRDERSGSDLAELVTDSPFMIQRYSADIILPQFSTSGAVIYLRQGTLYTWDRHSQQEIILIEQDLNGRDWLFSDIRINPQGTYAAAYSAIPEVNVPSAFTIFDLTTRPAQIVYQRTLPASNNWHGMAISPDGRHLAAGGGDAIVRIWDLADEQFAFYDQIAPDERVDRGIVDLAFSRDGRLLAGCVNTHLEGYAFLRDARTGEELARITGQPGNPFDTPISVAFHPTQNVVAFGDGASITFWNVDYLLRTRGGAFQDAPIVIPAHSDFVADLNFSPDGVLLLSASWDGTAKVWNYADQRLLYTFPVTQESVETAVFSPDMQFVATSSSDNRVVLWDLENETPREIDAMIPSSDLYFQTDPKILDLEFSPDGSLLAGSSYDGGIYLWNLSISARTAVKQPELGSGHAIWHLAFSPDGRMLASVGSDGTLRLWGVTSGS